MDFTFQLLNELTTALGIPGHPAPKRVISRRNPNPLGDLPQGKIGRVICQKNGTFEAPRVLLDEFMNEDGCIVPHTTKVGFIYFSARRQNV